MKLAPIFSAGLALFAAACGLDAGGSVSRGDNYETSVRQADEARKSGDLDSAIPLYGRALQADPQGVEAKLGLGQSYLALGAGEEAAAQFRDVLARRGKDPAARRGLAAALLYMGQPVLAEEQLTVALQADARDYHALNTFGVCLDMQGRHAEAQAKYQQGIDVAPDYLPLRSNMGFSLAISGQPQEAIKWLAPIATARGADARVRQNLAFAYAMAGDLSNALQVSRRDLDEANAQRQLSYFMQLKSLPPEARSAEMRNSSYFFPQSGRGA